VNYPDHVDLDSSDEEDKNDNSDNETNATEDDDAVSYDHTCHMIIIVFVYALRLFVFVLLGVVCSF
jgi:hypothetical protein